jgi:hypothetical protein
VRALADIARAYWSDAERRLDEAQPVVEDLDDRSGLAQALRARGDLFLGRGDPVRAVVPLRRSLEISRAIQMPLEAARAPGAPGPGGGRGRRRGDRHGVPDRMARHPRRQRSHP